MNLEKEFVNYEIALELKELGFDEPCLAQYSDKSLCQHGYGKVKQGNLLSYNCITPLYQQAFRWFREKYNLNHFIDNTRNEGNYKYSIYKREKSESVFYYKWNVQCYSNIDYEIYEEAELECLKKLIEIVKQNK